MNRSASLPYGGAVQRVGDLEILPVFDGYSYELPLHFYGVEPGSASTERGKQQSDWDEYPDLLDGDGRLAHAYGGFLVRIGEHLVLIDSGVGPGQIGPYGPHDHVIKGGELPTRLAELHVDPADITDVVFSHLHPDHYGWAADDGASLFPSATFRCHALDWDFFMVARGGPMAPMFEPLRALEGRLEMWDRDGTVLPGIDALHTPGHTPGSTVFVVSSGADRCMIIGDVAHCPIELAEDEWVALGDMDPALARRTRSALARELEADGTPVTGPHFPGLRFGRLLPGEGRRLWTP